MDSSHNQNPSPAGLSNVSQSGASNVPKGADAVNEAPVGENNNPGDGCLDLVEVRRIQILSQMVIPRLQFQRQVRSAMHSVGFRGIKFKTSALELLQLNSEHMLVEFFEEGNMCAAHRGQHRISVKDIRLANRIRGNRGHR